MSQQDKENSDAVLQWVTFHLEDEVYGMNVMQVQEVLRVSEIAPVPGTPSHILGIINLRGNVVTVIDTRQRFGLMSKEADNASRIIVVEVSNNTIGILVDGVAEVVELAPSEIEVTPSVNKEDSARFIQGVSTQGERLLILVDVNKLLSEEEITGLSEF